MVQSFSIDNIFAKLAEITREEEKQLFDTLKKECTTAEDHSELKEILLVYLRDELSAQTPTGMERLVLAIIRNEGLISLITVSEVFERAVALYNAENNKSRNPA